MSETTYSFQAFSASNLTGSGGNQAIDVDGIEGVLTGDGPYVQGGETAQRLTVVDRDAPDEHGETWFNDGTAVQQYLGAPVTFTFMDSGTAYSVTFPEGTQIQSEFATTMESGHVIRGLRLRHPETNDWVTAGYYVDPPPGETGSEPAPGTSYGDQVAWQGQGHRQTSDRTAPPCFVAGTRIETPEGPRLVESLRPGEAVTTPQGPADIVWSGSVCIDAGELARRPGIWPVRLALGAFGNVRVLSLSPQHRLAVAGPLVEVSTGAPMVLVPARAMSVGGWPGVDIVRPAAPLRYLHLACDGHRLIRAEGSLVETLLDATELMPGAPHVAGSSALPCLPMRAAAALVRAAVSGAGGIGPPGLDRVPRSARAI